MFRETPTFLCNERNSIMIATQADRPGNARCEAVPPLALVLWKRKPVPLHPWVSEVLPHFHGHKDGEQDVRTLGSAGL